MSNVVTVEDLFKNRRNWTHGEPITVVNAEGRVVATIEPREPPAGGAPYPFRDFDFGTPVELSIDPAELIIEERDYERSGKKHGV